MSASFYDISVATYLQTLRAVAGILKKGEEHAATHGIDPAGWVGYRLHDDMLPFSFQVISVWHHSLGAMKGLAAGHFEPPPRLGDVDYAKLKDLVAEAIEYLETLQPDVVNAFSGRPMVFRIGEREIPFSSDSFVLSFSLPNFFFHATTTYAILRQQGVALGKRDYLGQLRTAQ